jgi:SAM-dependent methyltransferase
MIEIRHQQIQSVSDEMEAYDCIYSSKGIRHLDSFYLWILSLLDTHPGQTFLDVSSGEGSLVRFALDRELQAFGIDFSRVALAKGAADYSVTSSAVSDAQQLPFADDSFDFVTNIGSVEHYFDPEMAVREMSRVLKPEGTACIFVPNTFSLFGNIQYAWQFGDAFDDGQPLQRYNTRAGWHRLLVENGLRPFETVKWELQWPRTYRDAFWYLVRPPKVARLLLTALLPLNLANSFVYLCHPVHGVE